MQPGEKVIRKRSKNNPNALRKGQETGESGMFLLTRRELAFTIFASDKVRGQSGLLLQSEESSVSSNGSSPSGQWSEPIFFARPSARGGKVQENMVQTATVPTHQTVQAPAKHPVGLRRAVTIWGSYTWGYADVGADIYVALGLVIGAAQGGAPLAFASGR
jgi:hypothetical protein